MSAASRWSERAHRWRARDKRRLRRIAALPLLAVFVALLTLGGGSPPDAAAQTSRTITMSIDGAGPPAGFTYPTMAEGLAGARQLRFTLDSPAPAGGIDTGTPGTAQNGNTQVIGTLIAEGDTSIAYRIHPSDDSVDKPNYAYVQIYPNTPPGGAFTVVPADRTVLLTVVDNDPTVVTLTRTDTGGGTLDEGGTARFEVSLSRPLVGAGDHGPAEVIAVPLRIDQTAAAVTTSDWSITLDADSPNTGVSLGLPVVGSGEAFAHQVVTFSGAGAQTAVLEVAAELDDLNQESNETITISLASNAEFDGTLGSATNVGGGADPHTTGSPPQTARFSLTIRNVDSVVVVPDDWALIPSGVQPGGKFRLLFITTSFHPATSGDIATYDVHVRARAAAGHTAIGPYAQKFRVVGSTASVSARNHAGLTGGGVPIYWLNGPQVAPNYAGFWSDRWQNWNQPDRRTQWGNPDNHSDWPWTGTATDGASHANHLGHATHARRGRFSVGPSTTGPISDNNAPVSQSHTLYGISPVFQVATGAPFDVNYKRLYEGERKTIVVSGLGLTGSTVSVSVDPAPSDSEYKIYYPAGGSAAVSSASFDAAVHNRIARFDIEVITDTVADDTDLELEFTQSGERVKKAVIQIRDGSRGGSILFRTCPNGGCSTSSASGWVESDRPLVQLVEGGGTVTYQYKLIGHMDEDEAFGEASVSIEDTGKNGPHNVGAGLADWDRIQCHETDDHGIMTPLGGSSSYVVTSTNYVSTTQWHDLFGGCPYHANGVSWAERNDWQTVTYSAGHDADAYDEAIVLEHKVRTTAPGSGYRYIGPPGQEGTFVNPKPPMNTVSEHGRITPRTFSTEYVDLRIVDDDTWDQEFLYSGDNEVTWTKASDGGLRKAIPDTLEAGATHDVHIKLLDPSLANGPGRDYIYVKVGGCGDRFIDPPCDIGVSPNSYGFDRPSASTDFDWGTGLAVNAPANGTVRLRLHVREDAAPGTRKALTFWNYDWLRRTDTDLPDPSLRQPGPNRNTASRYISNLLYEETIVVEVVPKGSKQVVALPPTLTIASAATSVTEGGDVTFTITANPAPQFDVTVNLAADEEMGSGEDLVASSWQTTIIIPAHQSTVSWTHTAYSDELDLADGTVVGRIMPDHMTPKGYTVGTPSSVSLTLIDDDDPVDGDGLDSDVLDSTYTVDPALIAEVNAHIADFTARNHANGIRDWTAVLNRLQDLPGGMSDTRIASWLALSRQHSWSDGVVTLPKVQVALAEMAAQQTQQTPPPTPEVNISAAAGGTEGSNVTFIVTASPAPTSNLDVSLAITTSGDFGVSAGAQTVTITGGTSSATLTLATTDDSTDEADGSVTATLAAGSGYTIGQLSSQTAQVTDDDDAPPLEQVAVTPVVSISGGNGVTEGGSASFTLTANPAPDSAITVSVTVSASGDYGATTGSRSVSIPSGGSATFSVATTNDSADEHDGSVTATLVDGTDYDLGTSSATVSVADDDDPPTPVVSIAGGAGVTEGGSASFTLTATPAPTSAISVTVTISASGDYGATIGNRTVTIPIGGSVTFSVATTNDSTDEPDGSVTATLVDGSDYDLGTSSATVSVADDDDPPPVSLVTVSIEDASASESASDLVFRVTLSEASSEDVTVQWTTSHSYSADRARGGQGYAYDFWHARGEIRIRAGETSGTEAVWLNQDSRDEPDEVFTVTLSSPNGATLDRDEATMTIIDDD